MNQRERFEAAWRRAYPNMHPIVLDHSALGYTESWVDKMWQGFQAGEASGLELAAKVCDEWATQFEPSSMAPAIDHYSARLLQRLSKAIRALLALEGE